jgi:putative photosynthetic complex assembly protein 2
MSIAWPVLYAVLVWWFATGAILYLDGLPRRTFPVSLGAATIVLVLALYGLNASSHDLTVRAAFVAFTCAVAVWGWMELSFLTGFVTGPRTKACAEHCDGVRHAGHAIEAILYHEFAIVAGAAAIVAATWRAPNQVGIGTFLVLWVMRSSAKLNLFLGVRNLGEAFLPEHLVYLRSFLRRRRMNPLFPVSVLFGATVVVLIATRMAAPGATPFDVAAGALIAALLSLAVIEHGFMMLPLPTEALWSWGFRSRSASSTRPTV